MGIPANPFGCTDLNITAFGYRLLLISHIFTLLSRVFDGYFRPSVS